MKENSRKRAVRFIELDNCDPCIVGPCYVPINFKLNQDGYFRKHWITEGFREKEMFHRFIWKAFKGEIPDDYEVDHMCRNRACCNINHLRCISRKEHEIHTNQTRYRDRKVSNRAFEPKRKRYGF